MIIPRIKPDFLIIGSAKCGTSTLYDDLALHPHAHLPLEKEPDILHKYTGPTEIAEAWARHYGGALDARVRGEASTYYTMVPDYPDVSKVARQLLAPSAKIIYMMRDPIARIESHLAHDIGAGRIKKDEVQDAALRYRRYVDWSDYALQIEPWIRAFGREQVLPVLFEEFTINRTAVVQNVARFVGLDPELLPARSEISKPLGTRRIARNVLVQNFIESSIYRTKIRPRLPDYLHKIGSKVFAGQSPAEKVRLDEETRVSLCQALAELGPRLERLDIQPGPWRLV